MPDKHGRSVVIKSTQSSARTSETSVRNRDLLYPAVQTERRENPQRYFLELTKWSAA